MTSSWSYLFLPSGISPGLSHLKVLKILPQRSKGNLSKSHQLKDIVTVEGPKLRKQENCTMSTNQVQDETQRMLKVVEWFCNLFLIFFLLYKLSDNQNPCRIDLLSLVRSRDDVLFPSKQPQHPLPKSLQLPSPLDPLYSWISRLQGTPTTKAWQVVLTEYTLRER